MSCPDLKGSGGDISQLFVIIFFISALFVSSLEVRSVVMLMPLEHCVMC